MSSRLPEHKPWPMRWVAVIIVLGLAGYTFLTLHFRKGGPPSRPYEDLQTRVNTRRLIDAGYQRIPLGVERPADNVLTRNTAQPGPGGLPPALTAAMVTRPRLPAEVIDLQAAAAVSAREPYRIGCRFRLLDDRQQIKGADLYVRGDEIVLVPEFEQLAAGLQTRSRDSVVILTVPPGALKPGTHRVAMIGERSSRAWTLEVK